LIEPSVYPNEELNFGLADILRLSSSPERPIIPLYDSGLSTTFSNVNYIFLLFKKDPLIQL
jgi:hypothetical protein